MPQFSIIGQGTAGFEKLGTDKAVSLIRYGVHHGMTHIDTAASYGDGAVEKIVGKAVSSQRQDVFISTKVWPLNASYQGIQKSCDASLKNLQSDYIDLFMLHWPSPYPLRESFDSLVKLKDDGKVRHIGVSNFTVGLLEELKEIAGTEEIFANQVMYNLNERCIEKRLAPYCAKEKIRLVAYHPLAGGHFNTTNDLTDIAAKHGKTTQQIALNFLHNRTGACLIPRSTQETHLEQNAIALDFHLSAEEISSISASYPVTGPDFGIPVAAGEYFHGDYQKELRPFFEPA